MTAFNPHMMTLARDSRGLTQAWVAARLGLGQGTVSKYETGFVEPPGDFAADLGRLLGYPPSFFATPGRPYGFPPFHYRRRRTLSAKALARIVAEINIRRLHVKALMLSFDWPTSVSIPEIDRDDHRGRTRGSVTIEDAARLVREAWMLPGGPIPDMIALLEENGGLVVPCDFGTDRLDAVSQRIDGYPVLFFVDANAPADRLRYALARELGHLVLHAVTLKADEDMEDEADAFAGAFLLPAAEIRAQLRRVDLRQIANMKGYWKAPMAAIAARAARLGLVTPYQSRMVRIEMGRLGYTTQEPNEPAREEPRLLRRMIAFHRRTLGYGPDEMASLLACSPGDFLSMYDESETSAATHAPASGRPRLTIVT